MSEDAGRSWWRSGTAAVVGIALGTVVVHLATGWRYGFNRDELMAIEDARHLAWGYVQYPPMTAFLTRVGLGVVGPSLVGLRMIAALAMAAAVVLTGLMANEIGGKQWRETENENGKWKIENGTERTEKALGNAGEPGRWAMVVAALAGVPFCLGGGALLQYISFDYLCWAVVAYCVVRVASGEKGREIRNSKIENGEQWPLDFARDKRVASGERREGKEKVDRFVSERVERRSEEKGGEKSLTPERGELQGGARWWVGVGVGMGLGMMAKYTMGFLVCGVVAGVLFTEMRRYLRSGWLWLGVALAWAIFLPNLLWEWKRNFVSLDFLKFLHARDMALGVTDWFLPGQAEVALLALPLAVAGLWFCFFTGEGKRFRILGWMFLVPLVLFLVLRGRNYYMAPGYPMLYAAGAVWVERKLKFETRNSKIENGEENGEKRNAKVENGKDEGKGEEKGEEKGLRPEGLSYTRGMTVWIRRGIWVALVLDIMVAGAVALPIAPVNSAWWRFAVQVDETFVEEIGWPEFVGEVAGVRDRLPAEDRGRVKILAGNYGEIGALNLYGGKFGLPKAVSGVNSSWERGYGEPAEVVIVVGYPREFLEKEFASCEVGARVWNSYGVANEETVENPEIYVCRRLKGSWEEFWERARKFA